MMEINTLRINGLDKPLGFVYDDLLCSWKVRGSTGIRQVSAKIQVALDESFTEIIYTKEGETLDSACEPLELSLRPHTRYFYRVSVTDDAGTTAQSEASWFETAKLDEPWAGEWIGVADGDTHPEFRKMFSTKEPVKCARLSICGLGLFEASINGERVGDDQLAPFINDYDAHYQYCTYDVTTLLRAENELSVLLGDGWYRGHFGLGEPTHYERPLALMAELRMEYADGSVETVTTDAGWQYRRSFTELSDIYNGETQDYLGWRDADHPWKPARVIDAPGTLIARYSPPLHDMETLSVKEVIHTPTGEMVLDFGQNFAGHVVCTQPIPEGVTMTWEFGEILQQGNFYHDNYRNAESKFTYRSDGVRRVIRPRFTFFGFRYVKVSGLNHIDPACFEGRALYSEMDRTGYLTTENEKINQLISNSLWGLRSNFLDMPTDCPQRDERVGWTGEAQAFCTTAAYHMDTRAFYSKFLRDLRSDQLRNGGATAIYLPNAFPGLYAAAWSDAATVIPKMLYDYYGSRELLARHYPLMKDWVDFIYRQDCRRGRKDLYDFGFQFGDWVALDGATEQSKFGRTDTGYIASLYYYASTRSVTQAAEVLGLDEAAEYRARAEAIRAAILNEYFTPSGRLAIDTQTGYLLALKCGVYREKDLVVDGLKARIKKDCRKLKGGFVGATIMNCVLAEHGMADLAYDFLLYEGFPGWLYAVNLGATTIWERWNSVLPDGSMSGTEMNSLNHYAYGSVVEFFYRYAAGIVPVKPGFQRVRLAPLPDIRLGHLECSFDSVYGTYISNWSIEPDGSLRFHFEIPFGCEADVILPGQPTQTLTAGAYDFAVCTERDYRALYTADTPLERLLADPRAVAILEKYLPDTVSDTDRSDVEAMSKGLADIRFRAALFRQPTQAHDQAIAEICALRAELL